ncbi:MAG: hypothetical protein A3A82_00240 [Candidatus Pacebacteria bacterium RIFCSPLOWO2_01_FULL_47_12]|nr:MAG: hypothetical protein A3J60_02740 [Candidatus Pacebacteria bacterium RIFCSPHIGHO2_02_FULL_46_9]OGJ39220.1 MAG: hypothetical protein A3A82_00240 [Candidatus Pacebacteria bacterium RIFCSPLOWO2_01_FULL_47_12]
MSDSGNKFKFHVTSRDIQADSIGKMLKNGDIPANIFGLSKPSVSVKCPKKLVQKQQEDLESGLLYVVLDTNEEIPVLLEEIQKNPLTKEPLHVAFKRVNLAEKIAASIPLEIVGECEIKNANILLVRDELPIEALPSDIPEKITIDISALTEIGQSLGVAELLFDRTTVVLKLSSEELAAPLVIVQELKEEKVEEPVVVAEVATDATATPATDAPADGADEASKVPTKQ